MKKQLLILLLTIASLAKAQDFSTLQAQQLNLYNTAVTSFTTVTASNKALQATITTLTANNTTLTNQLSTQAVATKKSIDSLSLIILGLRNNSPPVVVVPPPVVTPATPYISSFRLSKAYAAYNPKEQGLADGQNVGSLKDFVSGQNLIYAGKPVQALSGTGGSKYVTGAGVFLENEEGTPYKASASLKSAYPVEQWFVLWKPDYWMFESFIKIQGNYDYSGELGPGIYRVDSDGARDSKGNPIVPNDWLITGTSIPVNQYFTLRLVHTLTPGAAKANVDVYINNVKLVVEQQKQYWIAQTPTMGFGSETNNEYIGVPEYLFYNNLLSTADAAKIQAEIMAGYPQPNNPIAKNVRFSVANGRRTVQYDYYSPTGAKEDVTKRIIKWVNMPNASPTTSTWNSTYVSNETIVNDDFLGRVEITVFDTAGNRAILPASAAWNSL